MFVLASFISSVIDFQRRRRLKLVLEAFFNDINKQHMSLLCKRTDEASTSGYNNGMGLRKQVSAHLSDPELNIEKDRDFVLYFNECREIIVVPAQELNELDWRFCQSPSSSMESLYSTKIYFVAMAACTRKSRVDETRKEEKNLIYLNSFCSRVGFSSRKTMEGLYSCSLEDFLEIVYAWSVDSLYESSTGPAIEMIQTYMIEDALSRTMSSSSCIATTSSRDNSIFALYSFSKQKALPMLEQLFWGDQLGLTQSIRQKFFSESALNIELPFFRQQSFRLPTQPKMKCSTARSSLRYRAPSPSPMAIEFRKNEVSSTDFRRANNGSPANFGSLPSSYRNHSVPPYLRLILEKEQAKKEIQNKQQSSEEKDTKVPEVVPQRACPLVEFSSDVQKVKNSTSTKEIGSSVETFDDLAQYDENRIKIRLLDENVPYIDSETTSGNSAEDTPRSEVLTTPTNTPRAELSATFEFDPERQMVVANSSRESRKVERTNGRPHANFEVTKSSLNPLRRSIVEVRKDGDFSDNSSSEIQQKFENGLNEFRRQSLVTRRGLTIFGGLRASIRKHLFEPRRRMSLSRSRDPSQERPPQKPPSILVYSGNSSSLYRKIRDCLSFCLPADIYTVFNLSNDAIRSAAWIDPSSYCLLIADTVGLDDPAWHRLHQFFNQSGKIIFICQNRLLASFTNADSTKKQEGLLKLAFGDRSNFFGKEFETFLKKALKSLAKHNKVHETYHSKDIVDGAQFTVLLSKMPETPLLLYMENSVHRASAVFSDATTDEMLSPESSVVRDALSRIGVRVMETQNGPPPLTQGYLQMSPTKDWDQFESRILLGEAVGTSPRIFLRKSDKLSDLPIPEATSELLPIEITPSGSLFPSFDASKYFEILQAKTLGRCLIFVPVCTTTMDVCSSISSSWAGFEGVIVIARQQTHGRGRGGNEFISLPGTAMFTMNCTVRQNSALAERPSLIQHIMATAVAQAVSKLSGVEEFPFRIKWPNDFYFSRSHKVGGLLVTAKHRDNCIEFIIGVGVNVENSKPTVCLNDMLPEESTTEFSVESVIAETVTQFENLLFEFEMQGFEVFKERYESFWLHNREEVTLEDGDKVVIRGIDKNGYLSVKSRRTAKEFTIGDDGNTFDMMRGLIRHKLV